MYRVIIQFKKKSNNGHQSRQSPTSTAQLPPLSPLAIPPFFRHSGKTCKENVKSSDISSLLMRPAPMMALSTSATRTMERSKSTKQVRIRCWRSNVPWDGMMG